ncbi:uncharacterized protein [Primulina eburnea]|uniref:uncharacterized protein n=1 Tax=Primulina eburnea TaxID=1245227 RepID=UPI003C6C35B6
MEESSRKNYTVDEDKFLCHIYLDVSQDPIIGIRQLRTQFWSRVAEKYNKERRSDLHPRPQRSVEKRMGNILSSVARMRGCIRQIENLKPSGASEQDIMNRAEVLFQKPIGVKKAKLKKKRDEDISQIQRTMEEQHRELLDVLKQGTVESQQNYDLQRMRLQQEERKMEDRILYKKLSKIIDPNLREYTRTQQEKILQKRLQAENRDNFGSYFGYIGGSGSGLSDY